MTRATSLVMSLLAVVACSKPADKAAPQADTTAVPAAAPAAPPSGPQAIVTVLYKWPKSPAAFEKYYPTHLRIVGEGQTEIGFTKAELTKFTSALDGKKPAFYRQAELYFPDSAAAKKGMATEAFKKVGDDFKNFATGGLVGLLAIETGDKSETACPALVTVIYHTPKDPAAFEQELRDRRPRGPDRRAEVGGMRVVILASRPGWHTDELLRVFAERGQVATLARYEDLVATVRGGTTIGSGSAALSGADLVLARIIPNGSLEQIIFRVDVLHALEERGVQVVNSARLIERTVDKFRTSATLERHGLPPPATVVCESIEAAYQAREQLGGDVIVKPLFGSMGLGMVRVSDEESAFRVFRAIETIRGVFYLQRAIDHDGRDIRVFVVGSRVVAAIERRAPGWRTNLARGGEARALALPPAWADLAVRAADAVGAVYAGVDLLPARDGTVHVLEVNGIPGWQGLQQATGIDIAGVLVEHLLREPIEGQP